MHNGLVDPVGTPVPYPRSTNSDAYLATSSGIELHSVPARDGQSNEASDDGVPGSRGFSLPPVDEGKDAWLCLMGAFVLEMVVWGFAFSSGVLQDYYTSTEPFSRNTASASVIGSCCMGVLYLASPISLFLLQRWPQYCRMSSLFGLAVAVIGLIASSFATKIWQLIITQGIIYPLGACMLYYPVLLFIDEWFVRRKGLAFGVCWAGSGVSGTVFPFLIRWALSRFSFKVTMWAWSVGFTLLVCPFLPFVKPRIRVGVVQVPRPQELSFRFLRSRPFIIFQLGSLLQSIGYFAPSLYLPTYARTVARESGFGVTAPVTSLNAGTVIGFILIGYFIDHWHAANVILVCTVSTIIGVFAIWGLSVSLPPLCVFSLLYGIFAGSSSATWPGIVKAVRNADSTAPVGLILGLLTAGRGVGSIACGPISEALISSKWPWTGTPGGMGYGTSFGGLIIFTGATASFGVLGFVARQFGFLR
ncbi:major facilitator superfamily domain-containing protein [Aspergillus affinis]|uniref:major facilitator superfamily domain-containing protein n=1 Tax=Aspergillus affinis TaxID=1070780 RepID=UPI0022FF3E0D|nr:major facilitator superfamily domain-containing protein [Aspergillus affinis]KAI9044845.1 major facilitator superfamily domain-containing protein [Aspergillus affinis]